MHETSCVFCRMIRGDIEPNTVYESAAVLAIMDLRQANPGHVLVIPKQHVPTIYELPEDIGADLMMAIIKLSHAVRDAFQAEGLSIWQSNGQCAGQEVPHLHFHVHPRSLEDKLLQIYAAEPACPSTEEMKNYAEKVQACLTDGKGSV